MAHKKIIDSVKKQGQVTIKDLDEFLRFVINEYDMRTLNNNYISILISMQLDVNKVFGLDVCKRSDDDYVILYSCWYLNKDVFGRQFEMRLYHYDNSNDDAYHLNETKRTLEKTGEYVISPIYIYEHSNIALSTVPFPDIWDSACIGFAVANINDFMKRRISDTPVSRCEAMHRAEDCIRNELEAYSDYLAGNCWQYCITDEDGNTVDSCSGFIGDDLEKNGMLNYICDYIEKR